MVAWTWSTSGGAGGWTVMDCFGDPWPDAMDWLPSRPFSKPFWAVCTEGKLAPLLVNNDRLLLTSSFFALLGRERGTCFNSFVGGLATLEDGFRAIAVPAAGVAGSANENFSASGAAFDKEVRVFLGGIFEKLQEKRPKN